MENHKIKRIFIYFLGFLLFSFLVFSLNCLYFLGSFVSLFAFFLPFSICPLFHLSLLSSLLIFYLLATFFWGGRGGRGRSSFCLPAYSTCTFDNCISVMYHIPSSAVQNVIPPAKSELIHYKSILSSLHGKGYHK